MIMSTKKELFGIELQHYLQASKEEQGVILSSLERQTEMHRKSIIRALKRAQMHYEGVDQDTRGRPIYYDHGVNAGLKDLWDVLGEPCGELLHPVIRSTITQLQKDDHWNHNEVITGKLSAMSEATVKRRTTQFIRTQHPLKGISSTKPSKMKEYIPVFCGPWLDVAPGYGQIDTVAHCGTTLAGDFIFSMGYTDVATLWSEYVGQWNKGMEATKQSLMVVQQRLPWRLLHIHPDCGTEFLNSMVINWCEEEKIEVSRSRPYHKNDNGYIEQKNGHWVRRELGYRRLDAREVLLPMNQFYEKLCLYRNHFVPQRRCVKKVKVGKKYLKKYDKAQTPYERALAHTSISKEVKDHLTDIHEKLNLFELKQEVDTLKTQIFKINQNYSTDIR
jgi:hypothetical protein